MRGRALFRPWFRNADIILFSGEVEMCANDLAPAENRDELTRLKAETERIKAFLEEACRSGWLKPPLGYPPFLREPHRSEGPWDRG